MALRFRPMRPKDVSECVQIVTAHPVIGPRYGPALDQLRPAWLRLLDCEAKRAVVLEEVVESRATILYLGISVFVRDEFMRELKTAPLFWWGPELTWRIMQGKSPVLSDKELREANSRGGLNLLSWEGCWRLGAERRKGIHRHVMQNFLDEHRGYLWKEAIAGPIDSVERLQWSLQTGGRLWDPVRGHYAEFLERDPKEVIADPHIVGVTREMEDRRAGTWVGILFDYHPPQLGLNPSEQRLLNAALVHSSDGELAAELGKSLSTVKTTWRSIYNRASSRLPELFGPADADMSLPQRGREKRRHLLTYLHEHPEELRPYSRKLPRKPIRAVDSVVKEGGAAHHW
jgi:hypothetical protein